MCYQSEFLKCTLYHCSGLLYVKTEDKRKKITHKFACKKMKFTIDFEQKDIKITNEDQLLKIDSDDRVVRFKSLASATKEQLT